MSDYLSNLAAKSLNLTTVLQPRFPSLFEPTPPVSRLDAVQNFDSEQLDAVSPTALAEEQTDSSSSVQSLPEVKQVLQQIPHQALGSLTIASEGDIKLANNPPPTSVTFESTEIRPKEVQAKSSQISEPISPLTAQAVAETSEFSTLNSDRLNPFSPNQNSTLKAQQLPQSNPEELTSFQPDTRDKKSSSALPFANQPSLSRLTTQQILDEPKRLIPAVSSDEVSAALLSSNIAESPPEINVKSVIKPQINQQQTAAKNDYELSIFSPELTAKFPTQNSAASYHISTTQTPMPTIQVTIGRIEVRATPPPAPTPSKRRAAPPVMSLDEYLQKKSPGGGR